ncbi:hypothetical protein L7F22_005198 [Adiantum nelumboides]|nr:hypothetical protein [Adiantum nelumboides]
MSSNNGDLFGMLSAEDKLDGTNYSMWAYMMKHVLAAKNLWLYVCGEESQPLNASIVSSQASGSSDGGTVYADSSQAVAFLRKKLDDECMSEGESMDAFLTRIKDLREQVINIDEIISDASLTSTILCGLPDAYQSFATTLRLLSKNNPNTYSFDELVALLLQEEQSRANRDSMIASNQAFAASYKGKGKSTSSYATPKGKASTHVDQPKPKEEKVEKKKRRNYCRKPGHLIFECIKRIESEKNKKQQGLSTTTNDASSEEANLACEEYVLIITCIHS